MQQLLEKILAEIRNRGVISFARFMECALYCPVYGYYEKEEDTPGRRGDYYTSVSVGSLFGELLALQFSEWLAQMEGVEGPSGAPALPGRPLQIVEAGAHTGALAADILTWLRAQRPEISQVIEYWIIEPSEHRQQWQRRTLVEFLSQVRWAKSLGEVSRGVRARARPQDCRAIRGVIFSNELLDSMPLHRLGWDAKRSVWFEWGVTIRDGRLQWARMTEEQSEFSLPDIAPKMKFEGQTPFSFTAHRWPAELLRALPDGLILEVCPEAARWWGQAAAILETGKLLTIDYGFSEQEQLVPERVGGTLRSYHRHQLSPDVLASPGEQDITAHVNFSTLRHVGEHAGLKTDSLVTQEQFLTQIASRGFDEKLEFGEWTPARKRQLRTLTHPNHLGNAFRVLIQTR